MTGYVLKTVGLLEVEGKMEENRTDTRKTTMKNMGPTQRARRQDDQLGPTRREEVNAKSNGISID